MNVWIQVIPHKEQRYETCGDWWYDCNGNLQIRVSKMNNWKYEMLIAVHELVEVLQCKYKKISVEVVDKFDKEFEKNRKKGNLDEPGDSMKAPYRIQHGIASGVERILGALIGVDWNDYANTIENL